MELKRLETGFGDISANQFVRLVFYADYVQTGSNKLFKIQSVFCTFLKTIIRNFTAFIKTKRTLWFQISRIYGDKKSI